MQEIEEESLLIDSVLFCGPTTLQDEAGNILGPKKKIIQIYNSTTHLSSRKYLCAENGTVL